MSINICMYSRTLKILLLRKKAKCAPAYKGKKARSLGKIVFSSLLKTV